MHYHLHDITAQWQFLYCRLIEWCNSYTKSWLLQKHLLKPYQPCWLKRKFKLPDGSSFAKMYALFGIAWYLFTALYQVQLKLYFTKSVSCNQLYWAWTPKLFFLASTTDGHLPPFSILKTWQGPLDTSRNITTATFSIYSHFVSFLRTCKCG